MSDITTPHVAVIGAGITGVTTAYNLVKRGCKVTLFERHAYAAMETSFANGGQLSSSNAEVWNNWATVLKGLKWMLKSDAPLLVNPTPTWHKLSWMAEFIAAIPKYENNTILTTRMAIEARNYLTQIAADEGIEYSRENRGILHFYKNKKDFVAAAKVSTLLAKGGLERQTLTASEVYSLEPAIKSEVYGGYFTPSDFTGDIHAFTVGLAAACQRLGVTIHYETEVSAITPADKSVTLNFHPTGVQHPTTAETFDRLVVCGGVMSRHLADILGDRLNIYPVKGYSITVPLETDEDRAAAPWVSLLEESAKIVSSRLGRDRLRVAGTAEFNGYNRDIRADRIEPLVAWCRRNFPGMSTRQAVPWAGLRPMMPDMMPVVRRGSHPCVFYNTGHGHLGWTLSAATADAVGALVTAIPND